MAVINSLVPCDERHLAAVGSSGCNEVAAVYRMPLPAAEISRDTTRRHTAPTEGLVTVIPLSLTARDAASAVVR